MPPESPVLYCTSCGRSIGGQARCPDCGADNEFLDVLAPSVSFRFDEDELWTDEAILEALKAQGAAPPPSSPDRQGAVPQHGGHGESARSAASAPGAEPSLFFDFPAEAEAAPPGADPQRVSPAPPAAESPPRESGDDDTSGGGKEPGRDEESPGEAPSLFFDFPAAGESSTPPERPSAPGGAAREAGPPAPQPPAGDDATYILPEAEEEPPPEQTFLLGGAETAPVVATLVRLSPPGQGKTFELRPGKTSIGTKETDIVLDRSAARAVSRRHAELRCEARSGSYFFELTDLGSSNGTFIGGKRIQGPTPLEDDVVIRLGDVEFQFLRRS